MRALSDVGARDSGADARLVAQHVAQSAGRQPSFLHHFTTMGLLIARKTFGTLLAEAAHMTSMRPLLVLALSPVFLASCGGATSPGSGGSELGQDGGESDAQGTGGSAGGGTAGSSGSGTAGAGGVPGQGGACGCSRRSCVLPGRGDLQSGRREIGGPDECPAGASCYQNSICCSTVWCVSEAAQCEAYPVCDPGDRELSTARVHPLTRATRALSAVPPSRALDTLIDGRSGAAPRRGARAPPGRSTTGTTWARARINARSSTSSARRTRPTSPTAAAAAASRTRVARSSSTACRAPGTPNPLCGVEGQQRCPYTIRAL